MTPFCIETITQLRIQNLLHYFYINRIKCRYFSLQPPFPLCVFDPYLHDISINKTEFYINRTTTHNRSVFSTFFDQKKNSFVETVESSFRIFWTNRKIISQKLSLVENEKMLLKKGFASREGKYFGMKNIILLFMSFDCFIWHKMIRFFVKFTNIRHIR